MRGRAKGDDVYVFAEHSKSQRKTKVDDKVMECVVGDTSNAVPRPQLGPIPHNQPDVHSTFLHTHLLRAAPSAKDVLLAGDALGEKENKMSFQISFTSLSVILCYF